MRIRSFSSEGIVLSRRNYGEADRILTVFSKHFGKIKLLAKGVRKLKSKKRGHIEVFSRIRFSVSKGKGLDLMTEVELIDSYEYIRKDLKKVSVAYFLCEVISRITREEEKNEELFGKILGGLDNMRNGVNLKLLRKSFVREILIELGFWPRGTKMDNPDGVLEEVVESRMSTLRVGRRVLN